MLQLISKLQHNTYEKGEFSDEQPRDLEETINLIKKFPWDIERPLTDIQLTGPSITVQDNDLNYLKLGLYFGGKFCVYYLDKDNHLYEYHAPDLDSAFSLVSNFFDQKLNLQLFEKHFFNIGNQPHFLTKQFIYRIKPLPVFILAMFAISFSIMLIIFILNIHRNDVAFIFPGLFILAIGVFIVYQLAKVFKNRHQYLQISRGSTKFSFGQDEQHIHTYYKADIKEILYYSKKGSQRMNYLESFEIILKNAESIKLTGILIPGYELLTKFPEKLNIPITYL